MIRFIPAPLAAAMLCGAQETALDRYVRAEDPAYQWRLISSAQRAGYTLDTLELTSQRWLTEAEVDRPLWVHTLNVIRPAQVDHKTAVLFIDGGDNGGNYSPSTDFILQALGTLAVSAKVVVAQVRMVPNQPLKFTGDSSPGRKEDAIIAWSWKKYLETGDERWPARLPMTKAAVRAMDAVIAHAKTAQGGGLTIEHFILSGGSKRGWTTWSAAAVDRRVSALVPIVFDALNTEMSFRHHRDVYGFWAPAVQDYVDAGMGAWLGTESFARLMQIEDPYVYRERVMIPKMIVNATGDQFFLPDSSRFYYDGLQGEKYLRYMPNQDHGLAQESILDILAFVEALLNNRPRPWFSWKTDRQAGVITLHALDSPAEVRVFRASNPEARDFRLEKIGPAWTSEKLEGVNGFYRLELPKPEQGFAAFFLEVTYESGGSFPFRFTTGVVVVPDVLPFSGSVDAAILRARSLAALSPE